MQSTFSLKIYQKEELSVCTKNAHLSKIPQKKLLLNQTNKKGQMLSTIINCEFVVKISISYDF